MPKEGLNDAKTNIIKDAWERFQYEQALASERGAWSWLNVMPIMKYIFKMNKEEFRDVLPLGYNWELEKSSQWTWGGEITVSMLKVGYTHMRHNEIPTF